MLSEEENIRIRQIFKITYISFQNTIFIISLSTEIPLGRGVGSPSRFAATRNMVCKSENIIVTSHARHVIRISNIEIIR